MKIKTFILLIIAGLAKQGQAQPLIVNGLPVFPSGKTEMYFNNPRPGSSLIKFDFLFSAGNRMNLEFNSISQLDSVPQMNELLDRVLQDLKTVDDSLRDPLANRRIDYYVSPTDIRIRIINYAQKSDIYRIKNNETNRLKQEQDTLRIRLYTWYKSSPVLNNSFISYYYINLILNDISQLPGILNTGKLDDAISLLKKELNSKIDQRKRKKTDDSYYGLFDMTQRKRLLPLRGSSMVRYSDKSINLPPTFQTGIQYLKGAWALSLGVGLELVDHIMGGQERHYGLIWEPYYFFSRSEDGKSGIDRNSFISFRYSSSLLSSSSDQKIVVSKSIGFGFLVKRRGNWFEENTFKVALPGLQTRNLRLEPEFIFSDVLKGLSPSLKLILSL